jgi:hypothetical protein
MRDGGQFLSFDKPDAPLHRGTIFEQLCMLDIDYSEIPGGLSGKALL